MQVSEIINIAIIVIPTAYATLIASQFVAGLIALWHTPVDVALPAPAAPEQIDFSPNADQPEYSDADHALVDTHAAYIAAYWAHYPTWNVVPFSRHSATQKPRQDWSSMTVNQLRQVCNERGIRWNRAEGGKHLSKAGMIRALEMKAA